MCWKCNKEGMMKYIRVVYSIWGCITAAVIISCASVLFVNVAESTSEYELLISNWKKDTISEIKIQKGDTQCPLGEVSDVFLFEPYPTEDGCKCNSGGINEHDCCSSNQDDCKSCIGTKINRYSSEEIKNFGKWSIKKVADSTAAQANSGFRLCSTRQSGTSFLKLAPKLVSSKCQSGQKKCGQYCVDNGSKCPITSIKYSDTLPDDLKIPSQQALFNHDLGQQWIDKQNGVGQQFDVDEKGSFVRLYPNGNDKVPFYLFWRRGENVLPLVEGKTGEGNGICINSLHNNLSSGRKPYLLEKNKRKICSQTDPRYQSSGLQIDEKSYFFINDDQKIFVQKLPEYEISESVNYEFYARSIVNLGINCRGDIDKYESNEDDLKRVRTSLIVLFVVCLMLGVQLIFCEIWSVWVDGKKTDFYGPVICIKDDRKHCFIVCFSITKLIFMTVMGAGLIYTYSVFYTQKIFVDDALDSKCLDKETTGLFNDINENLKGSLLNTILVFYIIFLCVEPNLAYGWLRFFKMCCNGCKWESHKKSKKYKNNRKDSSSSSSSDDKKKKKKNKKDKKDKKISMPSLIQQNVQMTNPQQQQYPQNQMQPQQYQPYQGVQQPYNQYPQQPNNQYQQQPYQQQQYPQQYNQNQAYNGPPNPLN